MIDAAPKKRRKKAVSPTARTLKECRRRGWTAQVVERRIPFQFTTIDLFGCIDIVAMVPARPICEGLQWKAHILGIQATSGDHHADRRSKIAEEPRMKEWLACGALLSIWSWRKAANGRWTLREEAVTFAEGVSAL